MKTLFMVAIVLAVLYIMHQMYFAPKPAVVTLESYKKLTGGMQPSEVNSLLGSFTVFPRPLYLTYEDGNIIEIEAKDGRTLWTRPSELEGYNFVKNGDCGLSQNDTGISYFWLGKNRRTIQAFFRNGRLAYWDYVGPKADFPAQQPEVKAPAPEASAKKNIPMKARPKRRGLHRK